VRTIVMVTPERFHQRLRALGFTTLRESGDYYGYALALGSAEVTLAQLTNAYRAIANRGATSAIAFVPRPATATRALASPVMGAGASTIVADILADRNARAATFGMESVLASRIWSAVKTGTSKDMRDNWCIGFTDRYTVGVWVGNSSGAGMWDVSGTTGAAPVWQAIVSYLVSRERGQASSAVIVPASTRTPDLGIVRRAIRFEDKLEAPRDELFLAGTESTTIVRSAAAAALASERAGRHGNGAIALPVDGTIVAIDPDILPQRQRMTFRASNRLDMPRAQWKLDGRMIGRGAAIEWPVWPGKHTLEMLDAHDSTIDKVGFEVRGATMRRQTSHSAR
ncbi:MAG: penicillin-binding protein 1C, partial [Burkholderiaceae bacterium]